MDTSSITRSALGLGANERGWYAIANAAAVGRKPLGVTRFAERLVLFRDGSGRVQCVPARCPHRGADLGDGRVVNGVLECPYHGFRYDGSGACVAMPCEGSGAVPPKRLRLAPRVVLERNGFIWMYRGEGEPESEPPWLGALPKTTARSATAELVWNAPFARAMEGMMDIHHLPFAHRNVGMALVVGTRLDPFTAHIDDDGVIRTRGVMRSDDGEWDGKSGTAIFLDVVYPGLVHLGLSPSMPGVAVCSPIDASRTWIGARYWVDVPVIGALLARVALWFETRLVQPSDQHIAEGASPSEPTLETTCPVRADGGIVLWNRLSRRER